MKYKRYINIFFTTSGATLLMVALVNISVDPFAIFGTPKIHGWNEIKSEAWAWPGFHKTFAVSQLKPNALILGTSRAEVGMNPKHPAFSKLTPYNLAISGGNMRQISGYFDHAVAVSPPRLVIVGLDFHAFNIHNHGRSDFNGSIFSGTKHWAPLLDPVKQIGIAIRWQTLANSINTIKAQRSDLIPRWMPEGYGAVNPASLDARIIQVHGQRNLFIADERDVVREQYLPAPGFAFDLAMNQESSPINSLRHILREAYAHNIDVRLFISPVHARHLEAISGLDLWSTFENWKRHLVSTIDHEAKVANREAFPIWDFSGYNAITTEPVPAQNDKQSRMNWYWESSHYRSETGDLIINQMFGLGRNSTKTSPDFGVLLTPSNIESHLAKIRSAREIYIRRQGDDVVEVAQLINKPPNNNSTLVSR